MSTVFECIEIKGVSLDHGLLHILNDQSQLGKHINVLVYMPLSGRSKAHEDAISGLPVSHDSTTTGGHSSHVNLIASHCLISAQNAFAFPLYAWRMCLPGENFCVMQNWSKVCVNSLWLLKSNLGVYQRGLVRVWQMDVMLMANGILLWIPIEFWPWIFILVCITAMSFFFIGRKLY